MSDPAPTVQRLTAELLGTFVLVLTGCGTAVLAATFLSGQIQLGVGFLGVSLAFGLSVLTMAYAVGHVSGGHFNPAVTLGLAASGRFPWKDVATYVAAQVAGAVVAATVLFAVASGREGFSAAESGFATNGFGERSPGGYSLMAALVIELVLTGVFLLVILGVTDTRAPKGFAPMAIGLALTLIHLVSIPVTNTSVNPARSIGPALFVGWDAIAQLWLFLLAPAAGALLVGFAYRALLGDRSPAPLEEAAEG